MVFIKGYRKDALYHGMYAYDKILREIGRRLNLTITQVRDFTFWEIPEALLKGKYNPDELNDRHKFSVFIITPRTDPKKIKILTGDRAKKFLKGLNFEKIKKGRIKELSGTCGYPGKAQGKVRIVNIPKDMKRMHRGDILVSHATNPNLVPAMKKAGAIFTNAGGLTCHAAIVSREMKIPCVVGTNIATEVLKDGDLIVVEARKGVIKKI